MTSELQEPQGEVVGTHIHESLHGLARSAHLLEPQFLIHEGRLAAVVFWDWCETQAVGQL